MSFYVSTGTFVLLHCDEWDRVVALPRHTFVTGATLLQLGWPYKILAVIFLGCFFLCCAIMCLYVLSSVLWCPLRFPHKNDVRFVFTSSCLLKDSCLIYIIYVCLRIVVSNALYAVSLFCFFFVLYTLCCQFLWVVHFWLPLRLV